LAYHQEILEKKPLETSPSGVKTSDSLAWYQTLDFYSGEQDSFHRRHLVTPMAKELMDLKCNSCHQGSNPQHEVTIIGGRQIIPESSSALARIFCNLFTTNVRA